MKKIFSLFAVLLLTAVAAHAPASDAEHEWRLRASSRDDVVKEDIIEEIRFGREVAARILSRYGYYDNDRLMKYVNLVGRVIAMNTNRPEIEFRFAVLDTNDINAYAAPGGYVFITREALAQMRDEAELAGALAHEIAHITERHVVKELNIRSREGSAASSLAMLIGGSSEAARAAFSQAVDKAMDMLFKDGYRREDEIQADKTAAVLCALSGYDPSGLVRYFERLNAAKGKTTEILDKTHPSYDVRIAWLKGTIGEEGIDAAMYKTHQKRFAEAMKNVK